MGVFACFMNLQCTFNKLVGYLGILVSQDHLYYLALRANLVDLGTLVSL